MNTLEKIITFKKKEVAERKSLYPLALLEKSVYFGSETVSLSKYLKREDKNGIIAEIKRHSPSKGYINKYVNIERTSIGYMQAGASALSVLTDAEFFKGTSEDLKIARRFNFCPILRKDFIIDEYQIIESKSIGADSILLIAVVLTKQEIIKFTDLAHSLNLEVLLELHDEDELEKIYTQVDVVGVNNRNLKTLEIDINTSFRLANLIPSNFLKVSESGIEDPVVIKKLKNCGYNGFLIGSHFMKQSLPEQACKEFILELNKINLELVNHED
ncbi:MAG TPA: indole-3-glycerol phosphate synthase TrpC [Bacteroidia bacterium]|jgi:indole-3-glycerol phosphate synthase|nr:indole-3-glycerol phosphate synthase TrpC [Bacteroidia bacterium]